MKMGTDGFPVMPAGRRGAPMMMIMPGKARMKAEGTTMQAFADQLERFLNRPVVNETGLKGKYDFDLTFAPDMAQMFGGRGPMIALGPPGGGGPMEPPKVEEGEVPTLFVAVQEQLGLKLDSQKTSVDALIIDHLEKVPTEN